MNKVLILSLLIVTIVNISKAQEKLTKELNDYKEEKITRMEKMLRRNEYINNFLNCYPNDENL